MQRLLRVIVSTLLRILTNQEKTMADLTKLNEAIAALSAKMDALTSKPAPVDDQPAVDQAAAAVQAIADKIPA
jgi:hypothetical protein